MTTAPRNCSWPAGGRNEWARQTPGMRHWRSTTVRAVLGAEKTGKAKSKDRWPIRPACILGEGISRPFASDSG